MQPSEALTTHATTLFICTVNAKRYKHERASSVAPVFPTCYMYGAVYYTRVIWGTIGRDTA